MKKIFLFSRWSVSIFIILFFVVSSLFAYDIPVVFQHGSWPFYIFCELLLSAIGAVFVQFIKCLINRQEDQLKDIIKLPHLICLVLFVLLLTITTFFDFALVDQLFDVLILGMPTIILVGLVVSLFEGDNMNDSRLKKKNNTTTKDGDFD